MKNVIVIGAGMAGLAAAYKVRRAATAEGHEVSVTVVEKDGRIGGKVASEMVDGFVVDGGPDSFLTEKPALHRIAELLGMSDARLPSDESRKKTLILARGKLHEMPDGVMMFAPTKFVPFATTGLFSPAGKARMAMDLVIPKKNVAEGERNDETLESFVVRRMGRECLDRLAEPLVGGVHASDPAVMSLAATFPRLLDMEQKHGSLMLAFLESRKKVEEMRRKYPPKPGAPKRTFFSTFEGGMQQLTDGMADAIGRDDILLGTAVDKLERTGSGWKVTLADGRSLDADAVIVATEGWAARSLVAGASPAASAALAKIPHSSSATVSLGFDSEDIGFDLNAFGVLCPLVEKRSLMAATYSSTKWPGRAPSGSTLMRGFVGGPHNQEIVGKSDDELVSIVTAELRDILGLTREPSFARVFRWVDGMPQYTLGHLDRVAAIQTEMETIPGLALAGGSYTGVGLPNCAESGEAAATKVLSDLDITLAEDSAPAMGRQF